jgi:hypothetical protein
MIAGMDKDLAIIRRPGGELGVKRAAWMRVLDHWRRSGLGVMEFCRRHHLSHKRFFKWRQKLTPALRPADGGFVEIQATVDPRPASCLEVELGVARVRLPYDGSPGHLIQILQAVREAAC